MFEPRHVQNFSSNSKEPLIEHKGHAMAYVCDNGIVELDTNNKVQLDMDLIDLQENAAPGSKDYWHNLIKCDELRQLVSTSTS